MDRLDAFYQEMDSEALLDEAGQALVQQAKTALRAAAEARLAGMILTPDSRDAEPMRRAITTATGKTPPPGLLVGICPRAMVEPILTTHVALATWREEPGQPQLVLPVVASTKDGVRFGFFGLGIDADDAGDSNEATAE